MTDCVFKASGFRAMLWIVFCVTLSFAPAIALAQSQDERTVYDLARMALSELIERLQPHLPPEVNHLNLREAVEISVDSDFPPSTNVQHRKIQLPLRFVQHMLMTVDAIVYADQIPLASRKLVGYHWKLNSELAQPTATNFTTFWDWRGLPPPTADLAMRMQRAREARIFELIAFPIAHEIGHFARMHLPSSSIPRHRSITQEYEADIFARELLTKSGIPVVLAVAAQFPRYFVHEASLKHNTASERWTHPSTDCRVANLLSPIELEELWHAREYYFLMGALTGLSPAKLADELTENRKFCAEFSRPASTYVDPPNCPVIASLIVELQSSPQSMHGPDIETTLQGERNSIARSSITGADSCEHFTSENDGEGEYYSYSCEWRLGLTGDVEAISNVVAEFGESIAACVGQSARNYRRTSSFVSKVRIGETTVTSEAGTSSRYPRLKVRFHGIRE